MTQTRGSWLMTVGLMVLMCTGTLLAAPLVTTGSWLLPAMITIVAVLAAVQAARALTASRVFGVVGGVIALLIAALIFAAPAGPLDAVAAVVRMFQEFGVQLGSDLPPLRESGVVTGVLALSCGLLALVADVLAVALRAPAAALVALIPMFVVPIAVGLPPASWLSWVTVALATVLFLYLGNRWLQQLADEARTARGLAVESRGVGGLGGVLGTGVVAIVVALVASLVLPAPTGGWWQTFGPGASFSTSRVNPIIDLGDDLRRSQPVEVLRYATSQTTGELPYLSLVTLDEFGADTEWQPREFVANDVLDGTELPLPESLEQAPSTFAVNTNVVLDEGVSAYLPHPSNPLRVGSLTDEYGWNEANGDLRNMQGEALAQSFHVDSIVPRPTEEELRFATPPQGDEFAHYLELPDDPAIDEVRAAVAQVVDENISPYEQAMQLQAWFTGGAFAYSELAPVTGGYDGTSLDVIVEFLQVRSGYCVHFSSAMAIMGRILDIPTRIQVGFTPGSFANLNDVGQPVYTVTTNDLHSWAEFWVPGYGWVPFETTPASGIGQTEIAELAEEGETAAPPEQTTEPTPTPDSTGATPPQPTEEEKSPTPDASQNESSLDSEQSDSASLVATLVVIGVLLLVGLLALLPRMWRSRAFAQRRAAVRSGGAEAAEAAWQEILATAKDAGISLPRGLTTGATVALLESHLELEPQEEAQSALERLARGRDAAAFAAPGNAPDAAPDWADVESVREHILDHASDAERRRATWLPASLAGTGVGGSASSSVRADGVAGGTGGSAGDGVAEGAARGGTAGRGGTGNSAGPESRGRDR